MKTEPIHETKHLALFKTRKGYEVHLQTSSAALMIGEPKTEEAARRFMDSAERYPAQLYAFHGLNLPIDSSTEKPAFVSHSIEFSPVAPRELLNEDGELDYSHGLRHPDCKSQNHGSCYGSVWQCAKCKVTVCCNEGAADEDYPLCDNCAVIARAERDEHDSATFAHFAPVKPTKKRTRRKATEAELKAAEIAFKAIEEEQAKDPDPNGPAPALLASETGSIIRYHVFSSYAEDSLTDWKTAAALYLNMKAKAQETGDGCRLYRETYTDNDQYENGFPESENAFFAFGPFPS